MLLIWQRQRSKQKEDGGGGQAENQIQATIQTQFKAALIGGGKVKLTKTTDTHTLHHRKRRKCNHRLRKNRHVTQEEEELKRSIGGPLGGSRSQLDKAWLFVETLAAKMVMQARYERRHRPGRVPTITLEWCLQDSRANIAACGAG